MGTRDTTSNVDTAHDTNTPSERDGEVASLSKLGEHDLTVNDSARYERSFWRARQLGYRGTYQLTPFPKVIITAVPKNSPKYSFIEVLNRMRGLTSVDISAMTVTICSFSNSGAVSKC